MKSKSAQKVKLTSYDDLFGTSEPEGGEVVTSLPIRLFLSYAADTEPHCRACGQKHWPDR